MTTSAVQEFKDLCEAWQQGDLSEFCKIVGASEVVGVTPSELARQFKCASSTIYRWKTYQAHPHPFVQEEVVQFLGKKASMIIKAQVESRKLALSTEG